MWLPPDRAIVRQIVFNSDFDVIMSIDDKDEHYQDPINYMNSPEYNKLMTWENSEKFVPCLEILILRDKSNKFSYMVTVLTTDELDVPQWRRIRECTIEELRKFQIDKLGGQCNLFYPIAKDKTELHEKSQQFSDMLQGAHELKKLHKKTTSEIVQMLRRGDPTSKIAAVLEMKEEDVKGLLYGSRSGTPQPSTLAAEILRNSDLAKQLGLTGDYQLENEVLTRSIETYFPKGKKRGNVSKRPRIQHDEEQTQGGDRRG